MRARCRGYYNKLFLCDDLVSFMHLSKVLYLLTESQVGVCVVLDLSAVCQCLKQTHSHFAPAVLRARVGLKMGLNFKVAFCLHNLSLT